MLHACYPPVLLQPHVMLHACNRMSCTQVWSSESPFASLDSAVNMLCMGKYVFDQGRSQPELWNEVPSYATFLCAIWFGLHGHAWCFAWEAWPSIRTCVSRYRCKSLFETVVLQTKHLSRFETLFFCSVLVVSLADHRAMDSPHVRPLRRCRPRCANICIILLLMIKVRSGLSGKKDERQWCEGLEDSGKKD